MVLSMTNTESQFTNEEKTTLLSFLEVLIEIDQSLNDESNV